MSVPVGNNGLTAGLSYMESMTRPGGDARDLGLEANMKVRHGYSCHIHWFIKEIKQYFLEEQ